MASKMYGFTGLTGGGIGKLDAIDGAVLNDGDMATGADASQDYKYQLVAASGAAESSPDIISPDANAGTKRWLRRHDEQKAYRASSPTNGHMASVDADGDVVDSGKIASNVIEKTAAAPTIGDILSYNGTLWAPIGFHDLPAAVVDNNSYVLATDAAGTGTVNLIKANASDQIELGAVTVVPGLVVNSIAQGKDVTVAVHRKVVNIGDWDMDSTASVSVAHGLDITKIILITGSIRDDADSQRWPLPDGSETTYIVYANATNVHISRQGAGIFDNPNFNSTSFNRGWIVIEYVD